MAAKKPSRYRHNVYVVELDPRVLNSARFRRANPDRDILKPCVYVGMTGLKPEERFAKHKAGIRANAFVQDYGVRLLPNKLGKAADTFQAVLLILVLLRPPAQLLDAVLWITAVLTIASGFLYLKGALSARHEARL